jgi:hypothetical protein
MSNVDPSGFYAGMRDGVALPLLQQFGFGAAILVRAGDIFNPVTGGMTSPGTYYAFPCQALYGVNGVMKTTKGDTSVRVTTKKVTVDASVLTIQPGTDDRFEDEAGNTFEILKVSPVNPGGLTVMWELTCRY